jgi:type IV pilus assembly protein PilW
MSPMDLYARQRGVGLVETMVGILIGLLVVLVVYNLLAISESHKRTAVGISDAQVTGLLGQFVLGREAANGGNGISLSAADSTGKPVLAGCLKDGAGTAYTASNILRPIPVLVTDGGADNVPDSFITMQSGAAHVIWPVEIRVPNVGMLAGDPLVVQSPNGFTVPVPAVTPYWAIAVANDGTNKCDLIRIVAATAPDATGLVTLTQDKALATKSDYAAGSEPRLVNLGPAGSAARTRYDLWNTTTGKPCPDLSKDCQLYSTDLLTPGATRNPVAQNIVLLKVQYGVDTTPIADEIIDCWTPADNSNTCGDGKDYSADKVAKNFTLDELNRILAVRIGIVVRSDEPDLKDTTLTSKLRPQQVLFNCAANDATCQSRIVLGAGAASTDVIQDQWRYRTYETVVPLRNVIYNGSIP